MSKEGLIIFKTDNNSLYEYTKEQIIEHKYTVLKDIKDIYLDEKEMLTNIQTEYEKKFMSRGNNIKKIVFSPF
jgi:tRNA (guanine-N7-)-methyltransferase